MRMMDESSSSAAAAAAAEHSTDALHLASTAVDNQIESIAGYYYDMSKRSTVEQLRERLQSNEHSHHLLLKRIRNALVGCDAQKQAFLDASLHDAAFRHLFDVDAQQATALQAALLLQCLASGAQSGALAIRLDLIGKTEAIDALHRIVERQPIGSALSDCALSALSTFYSGASRRDFRLVELVRSRRLLEPMLGRLALRGRATRSRLVAMMSKTCESQVQESWRMLEVLDEGVGTLVEMLLEPSGTVRVSNAFRIGYCSR